MRRPLVFAVEKDSVDIRSAVNVEDLRQMAKRRLPKIIFDFIDGGVDAELGLNRNCEFFQRYRLLPRYLIDITQRTQSTMLFGRTYASPFGISPTGFLGLFRPGADMMLARAAAKANIPFVLSGVGNASVEDAAKAAPDNLWYQLYAARNQSVTEDKIHRAASAGCGTLVLTVDTPIRAKRERNQRNGFGAAKWKVPALLEAMTHPLWIFNYLRSGGVPVFSNWRKYVGDKPTVKQVSDFLQTQMPFAAQTWKDAEKVRRLWPGHLVLKGVLHPEDAKRAIDIGFDGIFVSNHGARQLDMAPAPLEALPAIKAAIPSHVPVIIDGGFRRGSDIAIARCLGADFIFFGRPAAFGVAAGAEAGAEHLINMFKAELDLVMGQMGCTSIDDFKPESLLGPW